ncbi:MAG: PKD domain-containing protein, partial [Chitinophagaceae bacterium]
MQQRTYGHLPVVHHQPLLLQSWTNTNPAIGLAANGTGNIPNFTVANTTLSPITATITVTPTSGCSGVPQSFTITVNPRPAKPVVVRPVIYCLNETASPLSATASSGNTLNWYVTYQGAVMNTPPTPLTSVAGNTTYYVTQTDGTCESDTARIVVTVNPKIANNTIAADQTICNGSNAQPLTQQGSIGGGNGSYQYQWQQSTDGGTTWTNISGATNTGLSPGVVTGDTKYRRVVVSSTCSDTSNIVTILVQGSLTNVAVGVDQTICAGGQPDTVRGQLPTGGNGTFAYQWESSSTGLAPWSPIPGATAQDYYPPTLTVTTYYRRKVTSGQCSVYSSPVMITVNPKPAMLALSDKYFCANAPSGSINFASSPAATSYGWVNDNTAIGLVANGSGNIPSFTTANSSNPKVPVTANIKVAATFTANNVGCTGDSVSFKIIVLPTINLAPIPDTATCTGQTIAPYTPRIIDTAVFAGATIQYFWTVSGSGTSLVNGNGSGLPAYTTNNPGTTDLVTTVTITPKYTYGSKTCDGVPRTFTITVKPATANASAGADQVLCAQTSASLSAAVVNGTSGSWSLIGSGAFIASPNANITAVTGLVPGTQYQFVWTQTGFASCPATKDTVVIDNKLPLVNKIDTVTKTICAGNTLNIAGQPATGGGNTHTYQWEQSTDGINFTPISGATLQNITVTPTTTIWLRRFVSAPPCNGYSDTVKINVQPALTNNTISASATICRGLTAPTITGSLPSGGNNVFTYAWEQSVNGGATWTAIAGATNVSYAPGVLNQTTQYRRIVSTNLCFGLFGSTSNVVTITVNPDAKAIFLPTDTIKCPPFVITPSVINLQPSTANGQYIWYANGVQIGAGTTFPGYTIANENDSVMIKLLAVSTFGCKNDSLEQKFKTVKKPTPSFTLTDTVGCGPLTVSFTNTSSYVSEFTYFWDFGNGQTSTSIQPTAITFAPNPAYGDTTYIVKLKVFSPCDTLTFSKSIRVKSKPKALFTPTKTTGCSPMKVTFKNTSKGVNNSYFWDFGDGTTFSTASADSVQHTFITGVVDTFYVKLRAVNECGEDSMTYSIIVAPNSIKLNLAINGTDRFGCEPHVVSFINNTQGASVFSWNFGDGNTTTTTKNIDTVRHTYMTPGTYLVKLQAINNCSDTTTTEMITVYPKPRAAFTANKFTLCIGDSVTFSNQSDSATAYLWKFDDGATSTLTNPTHIYSSPGNYIVTLVTYRNNPSGNVCTDSTKQPITITATQTGFFTVSDSTSQCSPFTVTMVNQNKPSVTTVWDMGDGTIRTGDSIVHTYQVAGTYVVKLTAKVTGGCTYITTRTITVGGPKGSLQYNSGFVCHPAALQLQAVSTGASNYVWDFGDGVTLSTTQQTVFHSYANAGYYVPKVTMQSGGGCNVVLQGVDTVKVDRVDAGFTVAKTEVCGSTTLSFTDTSHVFFGVQSIRWNFGDNTTGTGASPVHIYTATGRYTIQMILVSKSGCSDTISRQIDVLVKSKPVVSINAVDTACTRREIRFNALVQTVDPINFIQWNVSTGASGTGAVFTHTFTQPGTYNIRLVVGTTNGCYDTAFHTITINPSPVVTATPSLDLCR